MPRIRIVLLANWGIGEEMLCAFWRNQDVDLRTVITQFQEEPRDRWTNAVYRRAESLGYSPLRQDASDFGVIRKACVLAEADYLIVHAYPKLLPAPVFSTPKRGSVNFHPSLLPKYRGRRPTQAVLENGETETGITCHVIDEGYDTGEIIEQVRVPIEKEDNLEFIVEKMKIQVPILVDRFVFTVTAKDRK